MVSLHEGLEEGISWKHVKVSYKNQKEKLLHKESNPLFRPLIFQIIMSFSWELSTWYIQNMLIMWLEVFFLNVNFFKNHAKIHKYVYIFYKQNRTFLLIYIYIFFFGVIFIFILDLFMRFSYKTPGTCLDLFKCVCTSVFLMQYLYIYIFYCTFL